MENLNTKVETPATTISEVLSKIHKRKTTLKQQNNFGIANISLEEIHDVYWEAKLPTERKLQGNNDQNILTYLI